MIPRSLRARALLVHSAKQIRFRVAPLLPSRRLISLLLAYAFLVQSVPYVSTSANRFKPSREKLSTEKSHREFNWRAIDAGAAGWSSATSGMSGGTDVPPPAINDAVVLRHKPSLIGGRIEGTLRLLQPESFSINNSTQLPSDLYLPERTCR